jgi:hypothetical protein
MMHGMLAAEVPHAATHVHAAAEAATHVHTTAEASHVAAATAASGLGRARKQGRCQHRGCQNGYYTFHHLTPLNNRTGEANERLRNTASFRLIWK